VIERVIKGADCVAEGAEWLRREDPRFGVALAQTGPLPLRLKKDGFLPLMDAIISQQVSVASARAISKRCKDGGLTGPRKVKWASEEQMRACGLSSQKMRYIKALADANINFKALRDQPTDQVIATLIQVPGIGVWTAEIYAMFSLGRADVFAPGDLALQESARVLFDLPERPRKKQLRVMAQAWTPWRSVAARALWAYYHIAKDREGIT